MNKWWVGLSLGLALVGCQATPAKVLSGEPFPVRQGLVKHQLSVSGEIFPLNSESLQVGDNLFGTLDFILPEGSKVKKGQLVAHVNTRNLLMGFARYSERMALEQVELQKRKAEMPLEKMKLDNETADKRRVLKTREIELKALQRGPQPDEKVKAQVDIAVSAMKQEAYPLDEKSQLHQKGYLSTQEWQQSELNYQQLVTDLEKAYLSAQQLELAYRQPQLSESQLDTQRAKLDATISRLEGQSRQAVLGMKTKNSETRSRRFQRRFEAFERRARNSDVRAPVDGILTYPLLFGKEKPHTGMEVWDGLTIANISELHPLKITARVNELDIPLVKLDQEVEIRSGSFPDQVFKGKIQHIDKMARYREENNPTGLKYFDVEVGVPQTPTSLKVSMTVDLQIQIKQFTNAWHVPLEALEEAQGKSFLYLAKSRQPVRTEVKVLARTQDFAILKGPFEAKATYFLPAGKVL